MKSKILNALLIITSLLGYLEWGGNNQSFLFEAEVEILTKLFNDPVSMLHPLTVLPMVGQLLLLITLFQKQPNKILTYSGNAALAVLLFFLFIIGLIGLNFKIILSTIPFITVTILAIWHYRSQP